MSILGIGKNKRTQRKLDAIKRKMEKIEEMEKTLEEPSEMTGQGFNPVKDYHRGTLEASIKKKKRSNKTQKRKDMKISKHITYAEAIHSNTAKRKCIDNTPNPQQLENMKTTAEMVFEPLRGWVNGPIKVSSFFRSPDLNQAIGGVASSQHCKGQALDLDDVYGYKTNAEMFMYIRENLDFDQLIWEFGTDVSPNWIHVSYVSKEENRNRCLKAYKDEYGKTKYKTI